jgi:hypothetical protein
VHDQRTGPFRSGKIFAVIRDYPYHLDLLLLALFSLRIPSRVLLLSLSNRTC